MTSLFENLGEIYSNSLFLDRPVRILVARIHDYRPSHTRSRSCSLANGDRFEQVTFHYPGSQRVALSDFNLAIPARGIVAIVGANGAGKSTLIELLCRFYDPNQGRILLDGVDLRELDTASYGGRSRFCFRNLCIIRTALSKRSRLGI